LIVALLSAEPASAQKAGGILTMCTVESSASMSILEEATVFAERPMMGMFNNLVMFDQHVKQNSLQSIVPDVATSWSWSVDGTELTFSLHQGVARHDGKPFTAEDVVCTWDLLFGKSNETLRVNPRKFWYRNLEAVHHEWRLQNHFSSEATPTGLSHGSRKLNEYIKVTRNRDYWKKDRPYLDGIEYTIIKNLSTANLAFIAGTFDMTFPYALSVSTAEGRK
jgi:peptide/nickel transport system substrate-binding protein